MIEQVEVIRDKEGYWFHPALEFNNDEETPISQAECFQDGTYEFDIEFFEFSAGEEQATKYYDNGDPNISGWEPTQKDAPWFLVCISDSDDGPFAGWCKPVA